MSDTGLLPRRDTDVRFLGPTARRELGRLSTPPSSAESKE